jgi:hypothetical protein
MTKQSLTDKPSTEITALKVPPKLYATLGKPALISSESTQEYDELWQLFRAALEPRGFIDEVLIRNVTDLEWEARRARRMKASLYKCSRDLAISVFLEKLEVDPVQRRSLIAGWLNKDPLQKSRVDSMLRAAGFGEDEVLAQTMLERLDALEKVERMIAQAELRRNANIKTLEHHRASWAERGEGDC